MSVGELHKDCMRPSTHRHTQLASAFIVSKVTNANMQKAQRKQGLPRELEILFAGPKLISRIKLAYCEATISHRFCGIHHRLGVCSKIETHR
jgi:hypothetical protein